MNKGSSLLSKLTAVRQANLIEERNQRMGKERPRTLEERLRRAEAELQEQKTLLAKARADRGRFLSAVAHEMRTPLNSVMMLADLLGETAGFGVKELGYTKKIREAVSDVLELLTQVLELSKLESGATKAAPSELSLTGFLEELEEYLQARASEVGVALTLEFARDLQDRVSVDRAVLQRTLVLLLNVVLESAHRAEKSIGIRVLTTHDSSGGDCTDIEIHGSGFEIPASGPESLFVPFLVPSSLTRRASGGLSLTLPICRQCMIIQKGDLFLREDSNGAVFVLRLPGSSATNRPE